MHDEKTLGDLVEGLEELDDPARQAVCDLLDRWVGEPHSDQAKGALRERIRRCAYTRGFRASATIERIRQAMTQLAPGDLVARHRWLFASASPRHGIDDADSALDQITERVHVQRQDALRAIWRERGFNGLNGLCRHGNATRVVGSLMPEILGGAQELIPFVRWCLDKMSEDGANRYESCLENFLSNIGAESLPALADEIGRSHGESGRLRLLVSMPYRKAWELLETESDAFRSAYWEKVEFSPGRYPAGDLHKLVDRLLEVDRPLAALQAVSVDWDAVESSRLTKLLHALAGVGEPLHWLYSASIPDTFKSLHRRADVTIEEKAKLEFLFLRALDGSEYELPNLARQIKSSPAWYAEAVIRAFNREDHRKDPPELCIDDTEQHGNMAKAAYDLLRWVHHLPGTDAHGVVHAEPLTAWLEEVRALCARYGRAEIGDLNIGELLSRDQPDEDGQWPCQAVCEALQWMSCGDVDEGFIVGTCNARGVVIRPVGEGGDQERALAAKYRGWAQRIAYEYPHVGSILEHIASIHDRDAKRRDTEATLRHRFPNRGPMVP